MRAAVDASPLIYLTRIGHLEALEGYDEVLVPSRVMDEINRGLEGGHTEALEVRRLVERGRIKVRRIKSPRGEWNLDPGEAAVLALALREKVDEVIVDDKAAIGVAKFLGLRPVSVPFLLLRERRLGGLTQESYAELLNRLLSEGYYLSSDLYVKLLQAGVD